MKKLAKKSYNLKEMLDSDDELPTEYIETPFVPAYQNDNRFEYIEEQKKVEQELLNRKHLKPRKLRNSETIVLFGYLNQKDTFCFQCLEPTTSEKTLLWFFHFLMLKDLQSSYKFLTTCLVPDYDNDYSRADSVLLKDDNEKSHRLKVVVPSSNDMK